VVREEVTELPAGPAIVATGPLTSDALSARIRAALGEEGLAFFDAIAPIVSDESLDHRRRLPAPAGGRARATTTSTPDDARAVRGVHRGARARQSHEGHDWENVPYFEGCLPIEVMASGGRHAPLRPDEARRPARPAVGRPRAHAVVQLRREDRAGQMWNLVGFQTRLKIGEQARVFRMIPGLEEAEFLRWGSIHRNTYLNFPARLTAHGSLRTGRT
jgi:methylenetetrahydrofolate--tRNA-(uracil-5-)-methyltransferase